MLADLYNQGIFPYTIAPPATAIILPPFVTILLNKVSPYKVQICLYLTTTYSELWPQVNGQDHK